MVRAGIAIGPIMGGWATTTYTWRIVFLFEVVLVLISLSLTPKLVDAVRTGRPPAGPRGHGAVRERAGTGPTLRAGLVSLFTQNLILMGIFFVVPLYLQIVLGLDALQTGIKMLPVSITMLIASATARLDLTHSANRASGDGHHRAL